MHGRRHPSAIRHVPPQGWAPVAASGLIGVRQIAIRLVPKAAKVPKPLKYSVRLHFAEPAGAGPGRRVFRVAVQGQGQGPKVLAAFDIAAAAGGGLHPVVRVFRNIDVSDVLTLDFTPAEGSRPAVVCGIEVINERP